MTLPRNWHVALLQPPSRTWSAFTDVAQALVYGLASLGYAVSFGQNTIHPGAKNILLGAQHSHLEQWVQWQDYEITVYNFEPLPSYLDVVPGYRDVLSRFPLWDYSAENVTWLSQHGLTAKYVPLGYVPSWTRIPSHAGEDIDVLFYGSLSPRRLKILQLLQEAGVRPTVVFGVGGLALDALIARSRVVMNIHQWRETDPLEMVRLQYLWANGKAVVSEANPDGVPHPWRGAAIWTSYDSLVPACQAIVNDAFMRKRLGAQAFKAVQSQLFTETLGHVIVEAPCTG